MIIGKRYQEIFKHFTQDSAEELTVVPLIIKNLTDGTRSSHFCYHPILSISGSCRICVLEASQTSKPLTACTHESKILTQKVEEISTMVHICSTFTRKSKEGVSEFLLCNHPTDCPLCTQSGNCDLQDQSDLFDSPCNRFNEDKRKSSDELTIILGMHVKTSMLRCIHCGRCERFGEEIMGICGLGFIGRGSSAQIGTYLPKLLTSELSGNLVELCPVGLFVGTRFLIPITGGFIIIKRLSLAEGYLWVVLIFLVLSVVITVMLAATKKESGPKPRLFSGPNKPPHLRKSRIRKRELLASKPKKILIRKKVNQTPLFSENSSGSTKRYRRYLDATFKKPPKRRHGFIPHSKLARSLELIPATVRVRGRLRRGRWGKNPDMLKQSLTYRKPSTDFTQDYHARGSMVISKKSPGSKHLEERIRMNFAKRVFLKTGTDRRAFKLRSTLPFALTQRQRIRELRSCFFFEQTLLHAIRRKILKNDKSDLSAHMERMRKRAFTLNLQDSVNLFISMIPLNMGSLSAYVTGPYFRPNKPKRGEYRAPKFFKPIEYALVFGKPINRYMPVLARRPTQQLKASHLLSLIRQKQMQRLKRLSSFPYNSLNYPNYQHENPFEARRGNPDVPLTTRISGRQQLIKSFKHKTKLNKYHYFGKFDWENTHHRNPKRWRGMEVRKIAGLRLERFFYKIWSSAILDYKESMLQRPFYLLKIRVKDWFVPGPGLKGRVPMYRYLYDFVHEALLTKTFVSQVVEEDHWGENNFCISSTPSPIPQRPPSRIFRLKSSKSSRCWTTPEEPRTKRYLRIQENKLFWIPSPGQRSAGDGQLTRSWHPNKIRRKTNWLPGSRKKPTFVHYSDLDRRVGRRFRFIEHPALNRDHSLKYSRREPRGWTWQPKKRILGWTWRGWTWSDWKHDLVRHIPKVKKITPWTFWDRLWYGYDWGKYANAVNDGSWQRARLRKQHTPFMDQYNHSSMHLENDTLGNYGNRDIGYALYVTQPVYIGAVHVRHMEKVVEKHLKKEDGCLSGNVVFSGHDSFAPLIKAPMDPDLHWHSVIKLSPECLLIQIIPKHVPVSNNLAIAIKELLNEIRQDLLNEGVPYTEAGNLVPSADNRLDVLTQVPTVLRAGTPVVTQVIGADPWAEEFHESEEEDLFGRMGVGHFTFPFGENRYEGPTFHLDGDRLVIQSAKNRNILHNHKWIRYFHEHSDGVVHVPKELPPTRPRLFPNVDFGDSIAGQAADAALEQATDTLNNIQHEAKELYEGARFYYDLFFGPRRR